MSQVILSSNANSSLIQTLNQSDSKVIQNIYNLKEIYAPTATSWYSNIKPQSSNLNAGGSIIFNLPKYGFLEQVLFNFKYKFVESTASPDTRSMVLPMGSSYNMIDRIEFMSSSRVISTLYSADLIALHSNLDSDQRSPIKTTWVKSEISKQGDGTAVLEIEDEYVLPIHFGFQNDINTQRNLSFDEPSSIRIVWGSAFNLAVSKLDASGIVGAQGGSGAVSDVNLSLRYKQYNEADTAMLLTENYSEPQLNQLVTKQFRENPTTVTSAAGVGEYANFNMAIFDINLKNVDVVNAFYVIVKMEKLDGADGGLSAGITKINKIRKISLFASGVEICSIGYLQNYYSKLTENGYSIQGDTTATLEFDNVFKIQTGLYENAGGSVWSNGWSLREMNSLTLRVECEVPLVGKNYTCFVCETCSTILSTSSATGRCQNSLSN